MKETNKVGENSLPKICLISVSSAHYRSEIYSLMDLCLGVDFIFGNSVSSFKSIDSNLLRNVKRTKIVHLIGRLIYLPNVISYSKGYDVIIDNLGIYCVSGWLLWIVSKVRGQRLYYWAHGWYGKEYGLKRMLKCLLYKQADGVLLYGNYARDLMIKQGFKPEKLHVIYNSLSYSTQLKIRETIKESDIYVDHFGNDNPVLIFIGRLTKVKCLDLLIEALTVMRDHGKMCNLVVIGDGIEKASLQEMAKKRDLERQCWFYGASYNEMENSKLLFNADICVSPGNVGLTAIHSMTYGTPVITHNSFAWQMPEFETIKEGKTGSFFNKGDVSSLAAVIEKWLLNHQDRNRVRLDCYSVIDSCWNPKYQLNTFKKVLF